MPETNSRGEALHALRELVGRYGTDVLGDPQKIGQLARANPALAPYGEMLESFARKGMYERFRDRVKNGREGDVAIRAAADHLAEGDLSKRAAAEWVCRANWRVMESYRPSRPAQSAQSSQRSRKPARSLSLPSRRPRKKKRKKKERKESKSKDGNSLWETLICVARMLLGLVLIIFVLYHMGAVSLLARMDSRLWQHLPQAVQQIILQAPPISRELWMVESLADRPPILEFAKMVVRRSWYPAVMACLALWGGYLLVFAIPAAHQGQGLFRQIFGGAVALGVLAVVSMLGMSALFAILFLW